MGRAASSRKEQQDETKNGVQSWGAMRDTIIILLCWKLDFLTVPLLTFYEKYDSE